MKRFLIYGLLFTCLFSCRENNTSELDLTQNDESYRTKLDSYINKLEEDHTFMGNISLTKDGKEVYSRSFGFRDIEKKIPTNGDTKYRIGSITKSFTAVLIFKAIEENKIRLD